jgi:hypothetical protein
MGQDPTQDPAQVRQISKDLHPNLDPTQVKARLTKLDPMGVKSYLKGLNAKAYVGESTGIKALFFQMKLNFFDRFIF